MTRATVIGLVAVIGLATAALATLFALRWAASGPDLGALDRAPSQRPVPTSSPAARSGADAHWLVVGGGSGPASNQVSIEQDVALALTVLRPGGRLLFGGGKDSRTVQVEVASESRERGIMRALGDFFAPRPGRGARYRKTVLTPSGAATASAVRDAVAALLGADSAAPAFIYLAGHGEQGQTARDNQLRLWAQTGLSAAELTRLLDAAPPKRRVRVVATSCFSGGFAELVFRGAEASNGPAVTDRCGLFASPWDLESTGCDPNPDRRGHMGYANYFFHALRRQRRDGSALADAAIDFDDDGQVSLLEAHSRVRIASEAADVPTSSSERWLRHVGLVAGARESVSLPEERAVIVGLAARIGVAADGRAAEALLAQAQDAGDSVRRDLDAARAAEDVAFNRAAADLLGRWPVLDDPWSPDFARTLAQNEPDIRAHLDHSETYRRYLGAVEATDRLGEFLMTLRLKAAPIERLVRAQTNVAMAERLKAQGGAAWTHFERLLACERSLP